MYRTASEAPCSSAVLQSRLVAGFRRRVGFIHGGSSSLCLYCIRISRPCGVGLPEQELLSEVHDFADASIAAASVTRYALPHSGFSKRKICVSLFDSDSYRTLGFLSITGFWTSIACRCVWRSDNVGNRTTILPRGMELLGVAVLILFSGVGGVDGRACSCRSSSLFMPIDFFARRR